MIIFFPTLLILSLSVETTKGQLKAALERPKVGVIRVPVNEERSRLSIPFSPYSFYPKREENRNITVPHQSNTFSSKLRRNARNVRIAYDWNEKKPLEEKVVDCNRPGSVSNKEIQDKSTRFASALFAQKTSGDRLRPRKVI